MISNVNVHEKWEILIIYTNVSMFVKKRFVTTNEPSN